MFNALCPIDSEKFTVIVTDANLEPPGPIIVYAGGAIKEVTGYEPEELIGQSPRILQGPGSDREMLRKMKDALKAGKPFEGATINYRKDGTPFTMAWAVAPVTDEKGGVLYFFAIQSDGSDGMVAGKLSLIADKIDEMRGLISKVDTTIKESADKIGSLLEEALALGCNE